MNDIQKAINLLTIINYNSQACRKVEGAWDGATDEKAEEYQEDFRLIRIAIIILEDKLNNGWISCDMDLPTVSDEDINRGVSRISVLAISKHRKDVMIRQFDIEDRKFYDGGYGVGVIDNSIVAWQMLPKKSEWRVEGMNDVGDIDVGKIETRPGFLTKKFNIGTISQEIYPMLTLTGNSGEILRFEGNGDIFIHEKLIENDKQVIDGFREILNQKGL